MTQRAAAFIVLLAALGAAAVAPSASADPGDYTVQSCFADQYHHSSRAFTDFATRGMRVRRACNPTGRGLRGLVVGNVTRRTSVRRNARASMSITAAPGTVFKTFAWSGSAVRSDCAYGLYLFAAGPGIRGGRRALLSRDRGPYRNCPKHRGQAAASFTGSTADVRGATRITQRIICKPKGRSTCRARAANFMKLQQVQVRVQDVQPPSVQITGGNVFDGWVRGDRSVGFNATDNVGIRSSRVLVDGGSTGVNPRACDAALVVPCQNASDQNAVSTYLFGEGTHQVTLQATDASGLSAQAPPVPAHFDNTAPGAVPISPAGGEAWRNTNSFGASWANPAEPDRAPIVAAHYSLCPPSGGCEQERVSRAADASSLAGLQVPAPGEWALRMWREDAAGNVEPAAASPPITLRYDPEAPKLAFNAPDPTDPTAITASINDPLSGVAPSAAIEIAREGTGTWQTLPTTIEAGRLSARVDDATLPAGRYLLRANGRDNAGNFGTTTQRADGSAAVVTLPLRAEARLTAGFARHRTVRRTVRRKGKRRVVKRRATTLSAVARVRRNRTARVTGRLNTAEGVGLASAPVYVFSRISGAPETYAGLANTDLDGRFTYSLRADASRTLRFAYFGAPSSRPASHAVQLTVPAQTSFRASRLRLVNGQRVVFRGKLAVPPAGVPGGKLVEMQTRLSGRWQTFRTLRTDGAGAWQTAYRFRRTRGSAKYRFRVSVPVEAGYPYGHGKSRALKIGVRGR